MKLRYVYMAAMLALAVPIASCSTVSKIAGLTVSQKEVAVAVQAFDGVKATATNILKLPDCTATQKAIKDGCITQSLGRTIVADVDAGTAARNSLWVASKGTTEGIGVRAAYDAVIAATAALNNDIKG